MWAGSIDPGHVADLRMIQPDMTINKYEQKLKVQRIANRKAVYLGTEAGNVKNLKVSVTAKNVQINLESQDKAQTMNLVTSKCVLY